MTHRAHDEACGCDECFTARRTGARPPPPLIMAILHCPSCARRHYDEGEWRTRPHRRHQCAHCRFRWIVEPYCVGAHDCAFVVEVGEGLSRETHKPCDRVGVIVRHELGGSEVHVCEEHNAMGDELGYFRPLTAEVSP